MGSFEEAPLYTLRPIPGKGLGLKSTAPISPGTPLISEPPLFTTESLSNPATIEQDLASIVKSLPKDDQRAFLALHNNYKGQPKPFSNIIRSNGYPLGPSSNIGGIFPETARINHSCRPNAQHAWNEKLGMMLVHAVREIAEGEELTLSYIPGGPSYIRKATLKENFGFECACEVCSLPAGELRRSDEKLERAGKLDEAIGDPRRVRQSPERALADCRDLLKLYEEEKIFDLRLPRVHYDALQICAMHGDQARASVFAKRGAELRILCEGEESEEAENLERLSTDPTRFENFGVTAKWKTGLKSVPADVDGAAFERWLWRTDQ